MKRSNANRQVQKNSNHNPKSSQDSNTKPEQGVEAVSAEVALDPVAAQLKVIDGAVVHTRMVDSMLSVKREADFYRGLAKSAPIRVLRNGADKIARLLEESLLEQASLAGWCKIELPRAVSKLEAV
jgi:hypothetical protein